MKPEHVLAVQLLRHARERARQLVRLLQQEEPAAGLLRESFNPRSGLDRTLAAPLKYSFSRPIEYTITSSSAAAIRHFARPDLARVVVAVGEDQHHLASRNTFQLRHALIDGVVQPRRVPEVQILQRADELVAVVGERLPG